MADTSTETNTEADKISHEDVMEVSGSKKEATLCRVPIVEVSKESAPDTWTALSEAINAATYVALDLVSECVHVL